MLQLLILLVVAGWTVLLLGTILIIFAVPGTIFIAITLAGLSWCYCWYKVLTCSASFVHRLPHEHIAALCKYIIDVTPPCSLIIRYWRALSRRGILGSTRFYLCKSASFVGEAAVSLVRFVTTQHKLHLIKYSIQIILWPLVMLIKGAILVRHWSISVINWLVDDVNRLFSCLVALSNYFFGTHCKSYCFEDAISKARECLTGLPCTVYNSFTCIAKALIYSPCYMWFWLVPILIPEDISVKEPDEIAALIVKKVPLIGRIVFVQETAGKAAISLNNVLNKLIAQRNHVTSDVYYRCHVIMVKIHSYVDCYVSIPGEVVLLFVRETVVNKPRRLIAKWIQVNLVFFFYFYYLFISSFIFSFSFQKGKFTIP